MYIEIAAIRTTPIDTTAITATDMPSPPGGGWLFEEAENVCDFVVDRVVLRGMSTVITLHARC